MVVNGAVKYDDIAHLRDHLPDDITLNHMDEHALLALQGPKAVDALARLVPGVSELTFMKGGRFDWTGVSLWISRSGYTGEDGFEISVLAENAEALADARAIRFGSKPTCRSTATISIPRRRRSWPRSISLSPASAAAKKPISPAPSASCWSANRGRSFAASA
jgi:hypothetical protein